MSAPRPSVGATLLAQRLRASGAAQRTPPRGGHGLPATPLPRGRCRPT